MRWLSDQGLDDDDHDDDGDDDGDDGDDNDDDDDENDDGDDDFRGLEERGRVWSRSKDGWKSKQGDEEKGQKTN